MKRVPRIYTVQGITANLRAHSQRFGVLYQLAHARMFKLKPGWTVEQALGLAPRPAPKSTGIRYRPPLINGPRLAPPGENFLHAHLRLIDAEEYLRREGVPTNEHPLRVVSDE
jgi:hypothetical protein